MGGKKRKRILDKKVRLRYEFYENLAKQKKKKIGQEKEN